MSIAVHRRILHYEPQVAAAHVIDRAILSVMSDSSDFNLGDATTVTLEPIGPCVLTGASKPSMVSITTSGSVHVPCADGTVVEIKPGKSKNFFTRKDGRLHLLDCTCELCDDTRKKLGSPS